MDVAAIGFSVDTTQLEKAKTGLDNMAKSGVDVSKSADNVKGAFKSMRGATSQLSYQLQDIAVQAQMGTSAFVILGQQGPQIASVFGPGGAVFGAIIAVGAAIGGTLFGAMQDVSEETDKLEMKVADLAERYDELTIAQRAFLGLKVSSEIDDLRKKHAELNNEVESLQNMLQSPIRWPTEKLREMSEALIVASARADEAAQQIADLEGAASGANGAIAALVESLQLEAATIGMTARERDLYKAGTDEAAKSSINSAYDIIEAEEAKRNAARESAALAREAQREAEQRERQNARKAEQELKRFEQEKQMAQGRLSMIMELNMSELELINSREAQTLEMIEEWNQRKLISEQEYQDARREIMLGAVAARADLEAQEGAKIVAAKEAAGQMQMAAAVNTATNLYNVLSSSLGEQNALAKAAFLAQQGLLIAQTIMNAHASAAAALALPPLGLGPVAGLSLSNMMLTMGYMNAGIIAGQTLASFEGGGFTGNGSRSGGLDGKGGFMAMVHPNETIIDHTKGGSSGGVTIINQTTGRIDKITETQTASGDRAIIIQEVVDQIASSWSDPNSKNSRAFSKNIQAQRRR